ADFQSAREGVFGVAAGVSEFSSRIRGIAGVENSGGPVVGVESDDGSERFIVAVGADVADSFGAGVATTVVSRAAEMREKSDVGKSAKGRMGGKRFFFVDV